MRVAVEDLPGVTGADVSLEEGRVTVRLAPDNELTIARLRKTIRERGFSPRAADITVSGRLEDAGEELVLRVPGSGVLYTVHAGDALAGRLRAAVGREVVLKGRIGDDEEERTPTALEVTSVAGS